MATNQIKVFLSFIDGEETQLRNDLNSMLNKAGIEVLSVNRVSGSEQQLKDEIIKNVDQATCSLHILGNSYGKTLESDASMSLSKFQFLEAKKKLKLNSDFKMFLWYPQLGSNPNKEILQDVFINEIRYGIENNMVFATTNSPIQLVDDIRNMMEAKEQTHFDIKNTEVFLMFNQLDEGEAEGVIDMLSDIVELEKLNIIQDSDTDYSEFCNQQIGKSKLAVIYFRETSDWALPFVQQVWKKVGGAASHTPILLIGSDDPEHNRGKVFKAPKVISLIVSGDLIPLEIKVQYDKILEAIS